MFADDGDAFATGRADVFAPLLDAQIYIIDAPMRVAAQSTAAVRSDVLQQAVAASARDRQQCWQ